VDGRNSSRQGRHEPLVSSKLVCLFSNFVCERIPTLTPEQITTFVMALTSQALPMDEFWLFMMAKHIQDNVGDFSAQQVVTIARCYADQFLEDEEFFEALAQRVLNAQEVGEFPPAAQAHFLFSCGKVRFRKDELCDKVFTTLSCAATGHSLDRSIAMEALWAAGQLDQRDFLPAALCTRLLPAAPLAGLSSSLSQGECLMGLTLTAVTSHRSRAFRDQLMAPLLSHLHHLANTCRITRFNRRDMALYYRRLLLISGSMAGAIPRADYWSLPMLRCALKTLNMLEEKLEVRGQDAYEPTPSSFHLEVVAVLRLLETEHLVERPQPPFCLDLVVTPEQQTAAKEKWIARGKWKPPSRDEIVSA